MTQDPREEYYARRIDEDSQSYTDCDSSVCELALNLCYTYDLFESTLHESLQQYGISGPAFNLMKILQHHENQCAPQNEIGQLMLTSRANVTGLIDGLAKKGLVERAPHPTDRRVKLARLLAPGEELLHAVMPGHLRHMNESLQGVACHEREQLVKLLKKVRSGMTNFKPS